MRDDRRTTIERAYEHKPAALGLARVLLHDPARAEELCQEAFLRLMTATRELDASRPLGPLVLTTVRNLCLNELRRVRPGSLQAREAATGEVVRERPSSDPLEQLGAAERRDAVQTALARLSPAWREMVYLRDGLGLSYREVAALAETSEDVVRTTLYRARARLRELLAAHAPEGGPR